MCDLLVAAKLRIARNNLQLSCEAAHLLIISRNTLARNARAARNVAREAREVAREAREERREAREAREAAREAREGAREARE